MAKTQMEIYEQERRKIADANRHVMDMVNHPTNPITRDELHKLADKYPHRWGRFRHLLDP